MAPRVILAILYVIILSKIHLSIGNNHSRENIQDKNVDDLDTTLLNRSDEATTENVDNNDDEIPCVTDPTLCIETKEGYVEKTHEFPLMLMTVAYWHIVKFLWRSNNNLEQIQLHQLRRNVQTNRFAARRPKIALIHANAFAKRQLRSHREAAKMLVAVVTMFALCFFPVHLLCVLRIVYNVQHSDMMTVVTLISHVMCYVNAAVNPLIYNCMSGKYRNEFYRTYCKFFRCCIPPDDITAPESSRARDNQDTI
ncbi:unnamed protein product [Danaus chrysippus]|uniref:(African queen) hypothetical protein n=1 Tax=Danaus chrysippus TaxID=151541 RepID=A0A8J2W174_9NEOP|nr:unnamed protein product [Danaus chrysippus]